MAGMARPPRGGLRVWLGIAAAIGVLLVAGRLSSVQPDPASLGDAAPARQGPFHDGVEYTEPISGIVVSGGAVWVAHGAMVERLDPRTLKTTAVVPLPAAATRVRPGVTRPVRGLAATPGAIWVTLANPNAGLVRIDATSARVVAVLPLAGVGPAAVGEGATAGVWVVCCGGETFLGPSRLVRVDPATNGVTAQIALPGLPDAVGAGPGGVWVRSAAGPVWRIDPKAERVVTTITVPRGLGGSQGSVVVGDDAVWVSDPASTTVLRIDPRTERITGRVEASGRPLAVARDGTVVAASGGEVLALGRGPVRRVRLEGFNGNYATALAADAGTIWVADSDVLRRVDEQRMR